ncbi:MAG: cupin domain-containing protein [Desulfuromonadales bacterium]|jgi:transcriptional regulator with XRE-family HTH domain|nr:cupin domain-containing protein [Desulfuromonadales bacterium]
MSDAKLNIGEKIHKLRIKNSMSIEDVAEKTGLSTATISGIEDQSLSPPLGQLVRLANSFRVTVGELFGDSADSPFCIVRHDDRTSVSRFDSTAGKASHYSYESLGYKKQNRQMEPFLVTLNPGEAPAEPNQHVGEEILFVLEGQVEVSLAGHADILNPGDSIYYDSSLPHVVSCHGDQPAKLFAVIYARKEMLIF